MKSRSLYLLFAGLCFSANVFAAEPDYRPMKIIQTDPVNYPQAPKQVGIINGEAQVAIQIDEKGKLTDYVVTRYTHPAFADAAVAALKKWDYEPAFLGDAPHGATADLTFSFETRGLVVVDMSVNNAADLRAGDLRAGYYRFAVSRLSQLDRIPTPAKVVQPGYPLDASNKRRPAVVTVHFYIDEQGHVRLPAVSRETDQEYEQFAAEALAAVAQWQFEPPLSKGRPVLVSVRQEFNFMPKP